MDFNRLAEPFADFIGDDPNCHLVSIRPARFLALTPPEDIPPAFFDLAKWDESDEPPKLTADVSGRVISHEGRHRAAAMAWSGIEAMPVWVLIEDHDMIRAHVAGDIPLDELMADERVFPFPARLTPQIEETD